MKVSLVCHSAARQPIAVEAEFEGQKVSATIPGAVYELVSADGSFSTTLRCRLAAGAELEFAPGRAVSGVFTAVVADAEAEAKPSGEPAPAAPPAN